MIVVFLSLSSIVFHSFYSIFLSIYLSICLSDSIRFSLFSAKTFLIITSPVSGWFSVCFASDSLKDELHFTPDLVVPEGCECVLLVCSKPKRGMTYDVIDSGGGVVLRMEDTEATPLPRRKLLTPSKVLLGQCVRTQRSFPSQTSSEIGFELLGRIATAGVLSQAFGVFKHFIHHDPIFYPLAPTCPLRILNANQAMFAKLTYEPRQGRDDKVFIETISQKFLFFGSIQHQTLNLGCS